MEGLIEAHHINLPRQGNIYTSVELKFPNHSGLLVATLAGEVFFCFFLDIDGYITSVGKNIVLPGISADSQVLSIDAFRASPMKDEICIGLIAKVNEDPEYYFFTFEKQEDSNKFDLENLAYNCISIDFEVNKIAHATLFDPTTENEETVWILAGTKIKVFEKSALSSTCALSEVNTAVAFPEFEKFNATIVWLETRRIKSKLRRVTGYGCECGLVKFFLVDEVNRIVLVELTDRGEFPVSRVLFYTRERSMKTQDILLEEPEVKMVVTYTVGRPSLVYNDVLNLGLSSISELPKSNDFDVVTCVCLADLDMDGDHELVVGTSSEFLLCYKLQEDNHWSMVKRLRMSNPIMSIHYMDLSGDAVKELLVITQKGIHILQHDPQNVMSTILDRVPEANEQAIEWINNLMEKKMAEKS